MRFGKFAAVAAVMAGIFGAGVGSGTAQAADQGCIGLAQGPLVCLEANPLVPRVSLTGSTPVGATVPAFCYFLDCTDDTPVGTSVPVAVDVSRPADDTTVFRLTTGCVRSADGSTYCTYSYSLTYDAPGQTCRFNTNDPLYSALDGQQVICTV